MADHEAEIDRAISRLDLDTKVRLLSGQDMWTLPAVPEIGLASLVMSDGPIGVRGVAWSPDDPSVALPSPTALAATWDPDCARSAGNLLGRECRRRGIHLLLAPTVNLHRDPLGGRHFECYSEDPLLTAEIGAGYVAGVQGTGVGVCVKHFVANDFETERLTADVRVTERTLRELYLMPFERIVTGALAGPTGGTGDGNGPTGGTGDGNGGGEPVEAGRAWSVMAAYNGVNGHTMTENEPLLNGVLKREWGFDGPVVSDWTAARSTAPTALGGLDVVMPALGDPWGERLAAAVRSGEVPESVLDDKVRRILRLAAKVGAWRYGSGSSTATGPDGGGGTAGRDNMDDADGTEVGRLGVSVAGEIATRSCVLVRNERPGTAADRAGGGLLPLDASDLRRVAVLGALAADARVQGGGSAQVHPRHTVSPLDGLVAALPGVEVAYAIGADPRPRLPTAGGADWGDGFAVVLRDSAGAELFRTRLDRAAVRWMGGLPAGIDQSVLASVEIRGTLTPSTGGAHRLSINGSGVFRLAAAGDVLFEGAAFPTGVDPAMIFLHPVETPVTVELTAGEPVEVVLTQQIMVPELASFVSLVLGHGVPTPGPDELIDQAVALAAASDVAVVVVGTTEDVESEGFDRTSLALPGRQDELVARVAAANPRTVVVVNAGSPVLMPWVEDVAAVLLTWFPGQEAGAALANVLLGTAEPGGRLPTTWPRRAEDCPILGDTPRGGVVEYAEGVFIGYRAWQRGGTAPLFPFGHGLGYTTWAYESLTVEDPSAAVVTVRNTGGRPGREIVQVYVGPADPASAGGSALERPARVLAGFAPVSAAPGEAVTVRVPLSSRATQVWDGGWRTVPGPYLIEAGHSLTELPLSHPITA